MTLQSSVKYRRAQSVVSSVNDVRPVAADVTTRHVVREGPGSAYEATVIVPTRNEAGNVAAMLARLEAALNGRAVEVVFVDDSDDDTPAVILEAGQRAGVSVRLLHRLPGERVGGLGGAVLAGFRLAAAPWAVVMDGDLQHPPEMLPELLAVTDEPGVDLVMASRYTGEGDAAGLDGRWRTSVSAVCTRLAKLIFAGKLRGISDPMSGFFALRLGAIDLDRLRPRGYKILLEVIARSRLGATREVTYEFQTRFSGDSKASMGQGLVFLRQLIVLRAVALADRVRSGDTGRGRGYGAFLRHGVRLLLPSVLVLLAFPDLAQRCWHALATASVSAGVVVAGLIAVALLAGQTRPRRDEPDVHDRQLDAILGLSFLAAATWLKLEWPASMNTSTGPSGHEVVSVVLFLLGTATLVLGTRATARLKYALLVPLLGLPPAVQRWQAVEAVVLVIAAVLAWRNMSSPRYSGEVLPEPAPARAHQWPRARYAAVLVCVLAAVLGATTPAGPAGAARPSRTGEVTR